MNVRYRAELSQTEREELTALLSGGKHSARKLKRAQVVCGKFCNLVMAANVLSLLPVS